MILRRSYYLYEKRTLDGRVLERKRSFRYNGEDAFIAAFLAASENFNGVYVKVKRQKG